MEWASPHNHQNHHRFSPFRFGNSTSLVVVFEVLQKWFRIPLYLTLYKPGIMLLKTSAFLISCVLLFSSCKQEETVPEIKSTDVSGDVCIAAYCYVDYFSIAPIYPEDCPSCQYVWEVTNGASIVDGQNTNGVRVRAADQNFQVKAKIVYDGGETSTIIKDVLVEADDAIGHLDEITLDYTHEVLAGFEYNGSGYTIARTFNDTRIYKYYPGTDKWQTLKIQTLPMIGNTACRPHLLGTDEFYFVDNQNNLFRYDFSANIFTWLGTVPVNVPKLNYAYNGKYYSGCGLSNDSIFEYDPATALWSFAYLGGPLVTGGNGVKYTYQMANKAYIFLNTGGSLKLDYATNAFTAITGVGYDYQTSAIFELYGNLHVVNASAQYIINATTDQVTQYMPFINTCGTTLTSMTSTFSQYSFFGIANKGIAVDYSGNVFHFNPNY